MSKINGTFICLHSCNLRISEYYNTLDFDRKLCLAECFNGGCPPWSDSYILTKRSELDQRLKTISTQKELFFIESNSAHHLSKFLAERAYDEQAKSGQRFLVVNFDQHRDYGTPESELFCGNWGSHVCADLGCDYLIIGRKINMDALYYPYEGEAVSYSLADDLDRLEELYSAYDQIYVTVDMDVLTGKTAKRTNWPCGDMTQPALEGLLRMLPKEKIIAADIAGFPPKVIGADRDELDGYLSDLEQVAKVLNELMGNPPYIQ